MKGKGTIMEIRDDSMVIMTSDCGFEEIKKHNHVMVGMEIEFTQQDIIRQKKSYFKPLASMAAAIILLIVSSVFFIGNFKAEAKSIAMVTIDINPSIGLEINNKQKVVKILPLNEDAEKLPIKSLKGKDVRSAVGEIMAIVKEEGYLEEADNYVLVTTVSFEEDEDEALAVLAEELKSTIEYEAVEDEGKNVVVFTLDSNYETLVKAQKEKTSVGKMEFYQRLETAVGKEHVKLQDVKTKKVKELVEEAEERAHPVFNQHPGKNNGKEQPELKKDAKGQEKEESSEAEAQNQQRDKQDQQHPVFDNHPNKNQNKDNPATQNSQKNKESKVEEKKLNQNKEKNKEQGEGKGKKNEDNKQKKNQ